MPPDAPPLSEYVVQELTTRRRKDAWEAAAKFEAWELLADVGSLERGPDLSS